LRRLVVIATALAVLVGAASAYAATTGLNTYTSKLKFSPNHKAGALGFTQNYTAANSTPGLRTAPLTDIKTKVYGLVSDGKDFKTCSLAKIATAQSDSGCPKGALVASGSITALIGAQADQSLSAQGTQTCDPLLHVWNAGQGKIVYFFVDQGPNHLCLNGSLTTGQIGPFQGTVKTVGKTLVMDLPIPSAVSFPIGLQGSLTSSTLAWKNLTTKVHGKTVNYLNSVACKGGKRPYSVTFTAENGAGGAQSVQTVAAMQKCS
jgi:hypothetical protein